MVRALHKHVDHLGHFLQPRQHDLVPRHKPIALVLDLCLGTKLPHQRLCLAQIVSWQAWEEVVDRLELEAAVQPVQPLGAVDVHGGAQLALREGLGGAEVRVRHAPVGQRDLDVQDHGDGMGRQHKGHARGPVGQGAPDEAIAKHGPEASHKDHLEVARPPRRAELRAARREEVAPRKKVQIEASDGHDGVVGVLLVRHKGVGGLVPDELELVEGGKDALEIRRRRREEGHVLVVRVVFGHVGDEVVDIVGALPPADGEAVAKVADKGANDGVSHKIARDAAVPRIVSDEHDLLLVCVSGLVSGDAWYCTPCLWTRKRGAGRTYPKQAQAAS